MQAIQLLKSNTRKILVRSIGHEYEFNIYRATKLCYMSCKIAKAFNSVTIPKTLANFTKVYQSKNTIGASLFLFNLK